MTDKKAVSIEQVFLVEGILPDASHFFEDSPLGLTTAIGDADVVLDTNVLLIPYGAGASSLTQIAAIYLKIKNRQRLFIPAQVSREFVKNRPNKLAELYQGLSDKLSQITIPNKLSYPILQSVSHFQELNDLISKLIENRDTLKKTVTEVRNTIKEWGWDDPVSQAYRPIFTPDIIVSPEFDKEKILEEMLKRYEHKIPPGYKDTGKPDAGIGDFLIWKTILSLGKEHRRSVIFISGDEKADWLHGAEGNGFLPRYELQAEFRRVSQGHDLYIIPLSRLLELQEAEASSVTEIRAEERRIRSATSVTAKCPICENICEYDLAEPIGSSALPACPVCNEKFHLHRTRDGIAAHLYNRPSNSSTERVAEVVACDLSP